MRRREKTEGVVGRIELTEDSGSNVGVVVSFNGLKIPELGGLSGMARSSRSVCKKSSVQSLSSEPMDVCLGKALAKTREEVVKEVAEPRKEPRRLRASLDGRKLCGDVGTKDKSFR